MGLWFSRLVHKLLVRRPYGLFLSSTGAMQAERDAVVAAFAGGPYAIFDYKERPSGRRSPERECRAAIEESDLFVGLLGPDFGTAFPGDQGGRSIVQWEFACARSRPEPWLEIMAYIRRPAPGEPSDPRQQAFIDELTGFRDGLWAKWYASAPELSRLVADHVRRWRERFDRYVAPRLAEVSRMVARLLTTVVALATLSAVAAGGLWYSGIMAGTWALGAAAGAAAVILCCMVLVQQS
jgi:hypothetical protein